MRLPLSVLAFSAPLASATTYSISVFAPDTVVDGAQLNAAGQSFYTGISGPSTYCPASQGAACPSTHKTLVYANLAGMAVEVPGGQTVYVQAGGKVQYTRAHSSYIPGGSLVGGWRNLTVVSDCAMPLQVLGFAHPADTGGGGGVALCPDIPDSMGDTGASYALYAKTAGFNQTNCVDAVGLLLVGDIAEAGSWQYL
ncbi:hypothetical protein F4809DRAFT_640015 [Biscogniauxia mediterranea]|nr:hypothetical protein F4809DRAFT_640015 [Biscogniauxia mediterranea]